MKQAPNPPELIGQSPAFLDALAHASTAAALDRPLLVVGERGSGKELLAARIHFLSPRWEGPLIKVNCAAMNEDLLESELFGHEAGAFTGAVKRHRGRFERAEGGTLFLDEIASSSPRVQEKLLRVIEYGEYERIGGEQTMIADIRIVAAANVDLPARAAAGKFRADLLDRLAFDVITAPPLRARKEDIPQLAAHFASGLARELGEVFEGFTPGAMAQLVASPWPGNVRELKNAAERSYYRWRANENTGPVDEVIIDPFENKNRIEPIDIEPVDIGHRTGARPGDEPAHAPQIRAAGADIDLKIHLDDIEKNLVTQTLAIHGWNQRRAAVALKLSYDQIRGIVRKFGLSEPHA